MFPAFLLLFFSPAVYAGSAALDQAQSQTGAPGGFIAEELAGLRRSLSDRADDDNLFRVVPDPDHHRSLIELREEQFDRAYLISGTLDHGTGEGLLSATQLGS